MNKNILVISIIIFNILIDQLSKIWARKNIELGEELNIIQDKFIFTLVENKGAFLSIGSSSEPIIRTLFIFILPTILMIGILIYLFTTTNQSRLFLIGLSTVVGGGISNLIDRFLYNSVTDFLYINLGGFLKTGIFNIADVSIMVGMGILLIDYFFSKDDEGDKIIE